MTTMQDLRDLMTDIKEQGDPSKRLRSIYRLGVQDGVRAGAEAHYNLSFVPGRLRGLDQKEIEAVVADVVGSLRE